VAPKERTTRRGRPRRVFLRPKLYGRVRELHREHLADRPGPAAPDVVDLARLAALESEPVRPDHVTDVGPVTLAREVSVIDHRLVLSRLDQRDLAGDGACDEVRAASWACVVEPPRHDQVQAVRLEVL